MLDQSTMRAAVDDLMGVDPAVQSAAVASHDGLVMVSTDQNRDDAETVAAIASELLNKGRLAGDELNLGSYHSQLVFGSSGGVFLRAINDEMILVLRVGNQVNVGRVVAAMNKTAMRLDQGF